jgi:hypothetical protein
MKYTALLLFVLLTIGCSSSDDSEIQEDQDTSSFPLTAGSYWTYNNTDEEGVSRDSLYIQSPGSVSGETYTELKAQEPVTGFMTNMFANGELRAPADLKLYYRGVLNAPIEGIPDIEIPINDLVLYDMLADPGELGTVIGTIDTEINEVPLVIDYTITSNQLSVAIGDDFENGVSTYSPQSELIINLAITAQIEVGGITIPVPVMSAQDVLVATNSYTQRIGLTDSTVEINYELEDLSGFGITLPFPPTGSATSEQLLDAYVIAE